MTERLAFCTPFWGRYGEGRKEIISDLAVSSNNTLFFETTGGAVYDSYLLAKTGDNTRFLDAKNLTEFGSESFCVEGWFSSNAPATSGFVRYFFRIADKSINNYLVGLVVGVNSNGLFLAYGTGSADVTSQTAVKMPHTDVWFHVAVTYDSSSKTINFYKDGVLISTRGSVSMRVFDASVYIGHDPLNTVRSWLGGIQDICVTTGTSKYTGDFTPPPAQAATAEGTVLRADNGNPPASVFLRNQSSLVTRRVEANATGEWGAVVLKGVYDISYIADGLKPEIHSPYILE
ncbi:hypothetical protein CAP50_05850 [Psychrobacter sp. L7]|uniref:LamG-like jellyroll fold domain-containing protein n=1 Tax=Psychrobacter sp. L7 TaxID=1982756 RepID=UPI000C2B1A60|nr:LamG-like jellyroll fold domain-containing protein [Psychrobacter sp. L7]PJX25074.1 hypothetical protein CAP50_05850 [Psychrobacter sp. L7]